jgi:hypothetical protein
MYLHFGTLCQFHTHTTYGDGRDRVFRNVGTNIQTLGNRPKERLQHSLHGESMKSREFVFSAINTNVVNLRNFRVMYEVF